MAVFLVVDFSDQLKRVFSLCGCCCRAPGLKVNMGKCARLEVRGVDVVVASRNEQTLEAGLLQLHGIEPMDYKIVGKSKCKPNVLTPTTLLMSARVQSSAEVWLHALPNIISLTVAC